MNQMFLDSINDATAWGAFVALLCSVFVVVLVPTLAAVYGAVKVYRIARRANWNVLVLRVLRRALVGLLFASAIYGQGINQGNETVVSYSGTNAQLVQPNTPITNFNSGTGTTTFILPVANPAVALRLYITNNTANACTGFTVQMFSSTDSVTNTFNGALTNWQTVLLQNPTSNGLSPILSVTIPASGAAYVTSTAIQAPKVAIQLINAGACTASTLVEVTAVVASVNLSVPLISTTGPNPTTGTAATNVQGLQPPGYNALALNPLVIGGGNLSVNGAFLNSGLDSFTLNQNFAPNPGLGSFTQLLTPPPTQSSNELAFMIAVAAGAPSGFFFNTPWSGTMLVGLNSCIGNGTTVGNTTCVLGYNPAVNQTPYIAQYRGSLTGTVNLWTWGATFKQGTIRQQNTGGSPIGFTNANLAGSTMVLAIRCNATATNPPCAINTITSSEGNTYTLASSAVGGGLPSSNFDEFFVYLSTNNVPAGTETVTVTLSSGTIALLTVAEISGTGPGAPNLPTIPLQADTVGRLVTSPDAQQPNLWTCTVTLSTNTTTQCQAIATTIDSVNVRAYVTDYAINTTTAGTATTIQLVTGTGTNCGTGTANLSAIAYPNTTVGITSVGPFRVPVFTPLLSEVCVKQSGTTAGTSVVEVHGFYAP